MKMHAKVWIAAGLMVAFAAMLAGQIPVEPDITLYEAGNAVGIAYRGPDSPDASRYVEHWILFPTYVAPEAESLAVLEAVPGAGQYFESEKDFFARAPFPAGSKYVRAECQEFMSLPGRTR